MENNTKKVLETSKEYSNKRSLDLARLTENCLQDKQDKLIAGDNVLIEENIISTTVKQGPIGPQGVPGQKGDQGIQGEQGPRGNTGETGPKGEDGAGIQLAGEAERYTDLPINLTIDDAGKGYIVIEDGLLYIWTGNSFPSEGRGITFRGPQGIQGIQGEQGLIGPQGIPGHEGRQGIQGPMGLPGNVNPKGFWKESEITYNKLDYVIYNNQGWMYIHDDSGLNEVPNMESEIWGLFVVQGPQGEQGPSGIDGLRGATGATGAMGLKGDTGATGNQGVRGEQGPRGNTGNTGEQGIQGIPGQDGSSVEFQNTVQSYQELYEIGQSNILGNDEKGFGWYNVEDGLLYIWNGESFPGQGEGISIQGPRGNTGATGAMGPQGNPGQQGIQGSQGEMGPAGAPGILVYRFYWSEEVTDYKLQDYVRHVSATPPFQGGSLDNGWYYVNETPGLVAEPGTDPSVWGLYTVQGPIGPQGVQGIPGPEGQRGARGDKGDQGDLGPYGNTGATGPPGEALEVAGSFSTYMLMTTTQGSPGKAYYAEDTGMLYVYRSSGGWPPSNSGAYIQGQPGAIGPRGNTGPSGDQGTPGDQGPRGLQGIQGERGATGTQGERGPEGPEGQRGNTGPQGIQGIQGERGATGATGLQGEQGEQGLRGLQGERGATGLQGIQGQDGAGIEFSGTVSNLEELNTLGQTLTQDNKMEAYYNNDNGLLYVWEGSYWLEGIEFRGPQGLQGEQGERGIPGEQGLRGNTGATGLQGIQGDRGVTGLQGEQGEQGLRGNTGATGLQGIQGERGDTGPQGIQGEQGERRATGATGPRGADGNDGLKGDPGERGPAGPPGGSGNYTTATMTYSGAQVSLIREGNIVNFAVVSGTVGSHVNATVPQGFRPSVTTSIFTGLAQGSSQRICYIAPNGAITSAGSGTGAMQFSAVYLTTDPFPE